jgi:hypothetical protein
MPESGIQGEGWQEEHFFISLSWKAVKCVSPPLFSMQEGVFSGEPDTWKLVRPVRERGVGNVLTTRVRERGLSVSITLASPSGNEVTRQLPIS